MIYIYILVDPITDKPRYVGKTKNCYQRFQHHMVSSANPRSHKRNWINSLRRRGLKPRLLVIDEVLEDEWKYWEQYWICQLKAWGFDLVNHTHGGEGLHNGNQTSYKKGLIPWNKNHSGYTTTKRGQTIPQEVKNKISISLQGNTCKPKRPINQVNKTTMQIINHFESIQQAHDITGISYSAISNALSGLSKTAGGYIWQ